MNPEETCKICAYSEDAAHVPSGGVCHRYPPTMAFAMTPKSGLQPAASAPPPTNYDGWCGEWKKGNLVKVAKILPIKTGGNGGTKT